MKLQEIYQNSAQMYSVCKSDRTDNLVLYTVSGGIGMFSVMIELRPDEVDLFQKVGHLDRLAYYVARRDPIVKDRFIQPIHDAERIEFVASL